MQNGRISINLSEDLNEIVITKTPLARITKHITSFRSLTRLDLSHNCIYEILDPLDLPSLLVLDVSHNHLKTLDFMQYLTALRELYASNNMISSLHLSVDMLVPLSSSLKVLDVSGNNVAESFDYCNHVLRTFPHLKVFDNRNLSEIFANSWDFKSKLASDSFSSFRGDSSQHTVAESDLTFDAR